MNEYSEQFGGSDLPPPEVYDRECGIISWRNLQDKVVDWVVEHAPRELAITDYCCGTGYVLKRISQARPDLRLTGIDFEEVYIRYAMATSRNINFFTADLRLHSECCCEDLAICTAGLHHIPFEHQVAFVRSIATSLRPTGKLLLGEILLEDDSSLQKRRESAVKLGAATLQYAINGDATNAELSALITVLRNDLLLYNEFKLSRSSILSLIQSTFDLDSEFHTWSCGSHAGDFLFVLNPNQEKLRGAV